MRKIKFRYICKDIVGEIFTFIVSLETLERGKLNVDSYRRTEKIVARNEYTGQKDRDNKEIYEGDILQNRYGQIDYVAFYCGAWWLMFPNGKNDKPLEGNSNRRIIGNIYENKEILGKGKIK